MQVMMRSLGSKSSSNFFRWSSGVGRFELVLGYDGTHSANPKYNLGEAPAGDRWGRYSSVLYLGWHSGEELAAKPTYLGLLG